MLVATLQCLVFATWIQPRQPPQDIAAAADLLHKLSLRVRGDCSWLRLSGT